MLANLYLPDYLSLVNFDIFIAYLDSADGTKLFKLALLERF